MECLSRFLSSKGGLFKDKLSSVGDDISKTMSDYGGTAGRMIGIDDDDDLDPTKNPLSAEFKGERTEEQQKAFDEEQLRKERLKKFAGGALGAVVGSQMQTGVDKTARAPSPQMISAPTGAGRLGTGVTLEQLLNIKR